MCRVLQGKTELLTRQPWSAVQINGRIDGVAFQRRLVTWREYLLVQGGAEGTDKPSLGVAHGALPCAR